jgi:hypothetical protein
MNQTDAKQIAEGLSEVSPVFTAGEAHYLLPVKSGLHLCGAAICPSDERNFDQAYTAASVDLPSDLAQRLFAVAKDVGECDRESQDYIFDLVIDGDTADDFYTNAQLMGPIRLAVRKHLTG